MRAKEVKTIMATLTIRNLDDPLKIRLRLRAAARNRSMEEEARQILRAALQEPIAPTHDLGARIRARFAALGDVQLQVDPREALRTPPVPGGPSRARAKGKTPR
jgi:plasmid stability protein